MTESPIVKAVRIAGGTSAVSRALGVTPGAVSHIIHGRNKLSPTRVIALETACGGAVTRHELRPDVFGPAEGSSA